MNYKSEKRLRKLLRDNDHVGLLSFIPQVTWTNDEVSNLACELVSKIEVLECKLAVLTEDEDDE